MDANILNNKSWLAPDSQNESSELTSSTNNLAVFIASEPTEEYKKSGIPRASR